MPDTIRCETENDLNEVRSECFLGILAINGDRSPTNLEANRKYAPQFDAVIIKDTGHYPMLENPVRFNQLLTEVLGKLLAAK